MTIFNQENKIENSGFFRFKTIGDKIEGTLIGKRLQKNQLDGSDQILYEILTPIGEVWIVGGKPRIDSQMRGIKLGQIVGFEFTEIGKKKKPGQSPENIIQVYANQDVINKEWLQEYETSQQAQAGTPLPTSQREDIEPKKIEIEYNSNDKIKQIAELAKQKLGGSDDNNFKVKVMEKTGLAFIEANYDALIEKLKSL